MTKRWTRAEAFAFAPPVNTWPDCAGEGIADFELFQQRATAVRMYFENYPVKKIAQTTGVARRSLSAMAQRCLAIAPDGRIYGFRALIPYLRVAPYQRSKIAKKASLDAQGGMAGALQKLLTEHPDIESNLVTEIKKKKRDQSVPEFRIRACDLHQLFLGCLKQKGVSLQEWPFNTKHRGVRTVSAYMKDVIARHFSHAVMKRGDDAARAHLAVGNGFQPLLSFMSPFDGVELDAYRIDALLSVAVRTPEGTDVELCLERLWLIAAVERASTIILGWKLVYRSEVTATDVVDVIRQSTKSELAPTLTLTLPGLTYPEMPTELRPALHAYQGALWGVLLLDGHLAHLSKQVREVARRAAGFVLNYGAVAHFERRPNVEYTFGRIAREIFHRLPSTTGSHPHAGRAPDAEQQAVRLRIRASDAEQLVAVFVAQHNLTPNEGLSFLSPLEFLNYFACNEADHCLARRLPAASQQRGASMGNRMICTVRGSVEKGRRPYIQVDRAHYTNPVLANAGHLIGQKLIIDFTDENDVRTARAYLLNGAELGVLVVQGRWALTPHSRKTRKAINSLMAKRTLVVSEFDDPVQAYLKYLGTPKKATQKLTPQLSPAQATALTRVAQEAGVEPQLYPAQKTDVIPTPEPVAPMKRSLIDKPLPDFSQFQNRR